MHQHQRRIRIKPQRRHHMVDIERQERGRAKCLLRPGNRMRQRQNGIDMIRWNEAGQIVEFKVMVRPLKAINAVHAAMGAMLEKMK